MYLTTNWAMTVHSNTELVNSHFVARKLFFPMTQEMRT